MKEYFTFKNVLIAILVVLTVIFIAQNAEMVEIKLWFWKVITSRSVVIIVSVLMGFVIGVFAGASWLKKRDAREVREIKVERIHEAKPEQEN